VDLGPRKGGLRQCGIKSCLCQYIVGRKKRKGWKCSQLQSDNNIFSKRAGRRSKMAIEVQECGHREDCKQQSEAEMDKELAEIRARMEELAFRMQQDAKSRWVYEWLMKSKVQWPVKELLDSKAAEVVEGRAEVCGRPQA
jgi:hypothetical protein